MNEVIGICEELVSSAENMVSFAIAAAVIPPALNNSEMRGRRGTGSTNNGIDKKLETDGFCPANVAISATPTRDEAPCSPTAPDDNGNSGIT